MYVEICQLRTKYIVPVSDYDQSTNATTFALDKWKCELWDW